MDEVMANTFARWGIASVPEWLTPDQKAKILVISLGLGSLFNEEVEAERHWMQTPLAEFKTRPITMVLAGNIDAVMRRVDRERNL